MSALNLQGVFAVPPLARKASPARAIDFDQNQILVKHILSGGVTRLVYGGNAFIYHVTLDEFSELLPWFNSLVGDVEVIPGIGPTFGRAMDQAKLIRKYPFHAAMVLPCADPRDAFGLEQGYREIAEAANTRLMLYIKDESNFGPDRDAGLDAVARLVDDGICAGIKYAIVRDNPADDAYLASLLTRVDRSLVISGIGERPAIVHMKSWDLPGFTTGSGCLAPSLSQLLFEACQCREYEIAEAFRAPFITLEDLRDEWGPAKVLHHALELAGIVKTGPLVPYVSALDREQLKTLEPVAQTLARANAEVGVQELI